MTEFRKLIVLDLDDTLWIGTLGEDGQNNLRPNVAFQQGLKSLQERGVLLAIASKNYEEPALEAIRTLPGMILRENDFVAWRIDWNDKAANIAEMVTGLNLGLQSVVFIDDNPHQRGRVREALPEVLVPDWPTEQERYAEALDELDVFDTSIPTEEDRMRTQMYARERERAKAKSQAGSIDDWLKNLGTQLMIEDLSRFSHRENFPRTVQLLNKTNQMNLRTRRLSEEEFDRWLATSGNRCYTFKVSDRFGDAGLTGILSIEFRNEQAEIVDFVLSCRVMGRLVEEAMVAHALNEADLRSCTKVIAEYSQSTKNQPCLEFWQQRSGFVQTGNTFTHEIK